MSGTATHRRRGPRALLIVGGLAVALAACSTPTPGRTDLTDTFERTGMSKVEARCISDAILDTLTEEQVASIVERGPSGAPTDPEGSTNGPATKVREAMVACHASATTTSSATTPTSVSGGGAPSTTAFTTGSSDEAPLVPSNGAQLNPASTSSTTSTTNP